MSAIITENFRRNNTRLFLNDILNSTDNKYYLGIGKQDSWAEDEENIEFLIPGAVGTRADELEVLNNLSTLVSLNSVNGVGRVIPAVPWKIDDTYKAYSSYDSSCFYPNGTVQPCYVTISGSIFLCLKAGTAGSTFQPTRVTTDPLTKYAPFSYGDGYIWVLVQETPPFDIIRNNTFTDIRTTVLTDTEESNSIAQCGGLVTSFNIVKGGLGYSKTGATPSVLRLKVNDGFTVGAAGTDRSGNSVSQISLDFEVDNTGAITTVSFPSGGFNIPASKGALFASIEFSGPGSGATIIPTIAPPKGFAYDPSAVMTSWFAGLSISLDDSVSGDNFYSRYRQISIIKNPKVQVGKETDLTLNALRYINFPIETSIDANIAINSSVLRNAAGDIIGHADKLITESNGTKKLYFHQNISSGYRELPPTGNIKIDGSNNPYQYDSINTGEFINDGNAEVLFTENRSFITRSAGQTEDLIIIIQF